VIPKGHDIDGPMEILVINVFMGGMIRGDRSCLEITGGGSISRESGGIGRSDGDKISWKALQDMMSISEKQKGRTI
jgi:hypothetical protein